MDKKALRLKRWKIRPWVNINARTGCSPVTLESEKTTLANLVARNVLYRAIELNASDVRNKRLFTEPIKTTNNTTQLVSMGF